MYIRFSLVLFAMVACGKIPDAATGDDDDDAPETGLASVTVVSQDLPRPGVPVTFQAPDGSTQVINTDATGKATATIVAGTDIWATWDDINDSGVQHSTVTIVDVGPGDDINFSPARDLTIQPLDSSISLPGSFAGASKYLLFAGECNTSWAPSAPSVSMHFDPDCLLADHTSVDLYALAYATDGTLLAWTGLMDTMVSPLMNLEAWHSDVSGWTGSVINLPADASSQSLSLALISHGMLTWIERENGVAPTNRTIGGETPDLGSGPGPRRVEVTASNDTAGEPPYAVTIIAQHAAANDAPFAIDFDKALPPIEGLTWDTATSSVKLTLGGSPAARGHLADADAALAAFHWGDETNGNTWFVILPPEAVAAPLPLTPPAGFTLPSGSEPNFLPFIAEIVSMSFLADYHQFLDFPGLVLGTIPSVTDELSGSLSRYGDK
jgi:hypothetical protein